MDVGMDEELGIDIDVDLDMDMVLLQQQYALPAGTCHESQHPPPALTRQQYSTDSEGRLFSEVARLLSSSSSQLGEADRHQASLPSKSRSQCAFPGCEKLSRGKSGMCVSHGGGRRCALCNNSAAPGSEYCRSHGGGRRCQTPDCPRAAQRATDFCIRHGGGVRCSVDGCTSGARGATGKCFSHGGGRRCEREGCRRAVAARSTLCKHHAGSQLKANSK